jgi:hypothetical protein
VKCTTELIAGKNMITKLNCHFLEGQIYCSGTASAAHNMKKKLFSTRGYTDLLQDQSRRRRRNGTYARTKFLCYAKKKTQHIFDGKFWSFNCMKQS